MRPLEQQSKSVISDAQDTAGKTFLNYFADLDIF